MSRFMDDFAKEYPESVIRRGGEIFVFAHSAVSFVEQASAAGARILGMEACVISAEVVYPSLSRIAEFSADDAPEAAAQAVALLEGPWASPPSADEQIHSDAVGDYVVAFVIDPR